VQQAQHEMLQAQQESMNDLKKMVALLLKKSKRTKSPKTKASSRESKDKKKKGENFTSKHSDGNEDNLGYENSDILLKN